jgi:CMP-N-acetylneuraminic acid synthetase
MKSAAFIPIKSHSERVPGKNFRAWKGRPLYQWIITRALDAGCFADVFVDTDSTAAAEFAASAGAQVIHRLPALASNSANGNDLLCHHYDLHPTFDAYFQLFATAPELKPETIARCVRLLATSNDYDSILTMRYAPGPWVWTMIDGELIFPRYRPDALPRSQDWQRSVREVVETTGLYGIKREALARKRMRIGNRPLPYFVGDDEAVDIDTPEDMAIGESA